MAVVYATFLLQAVAALITGVVFLSFTRHYRRGFLLHWTRSWFAATVHLLYSALGLGLAQTQAASSPVRVAVAIVAAIAGYVQVVWLLCGTQELATGMPVPRREYRVLMGAFIVLGVLTATLYAWDPEAGFARFTLRVSVRCLVLTITFGIAAWVVWRASRGRMLGPQVVAGAFFLYAVEQVHVLVASTLATMGMRTFDYASWLGYADVLLQFAMALGLVIWLLEDERKATLQASAQIEHLAYHDALTGLPNRQLLLDRLERAIASAHRHGERLAVCFLDVDRFKIINDSLGHSAGDILLRGIAQRMTGLLRDNDTVARIGGDEFVLVAPDLASVEDAVAIARRVRDAVKEPVAISGRELVVSASIGISLYPDDGADAETLLKHADVAMYRAKQQGRDTFQLFTKTMNARALEQLAMESALRRAVTAGEFEIHYQPILEFAGAGTAEPVDAVEALIRWRHPELGLLPPDQFIPIAEATGLIVEIGEWVLREAGARVRELRATVAPGLRVACNLSVRQLQRPDFVAHLAGILADTGLPAPALELEITESIAMQGGDESLERLRALKALGVRISIDDFGTGYSSLSALRLLPVDTLKIDRSFVMGMSATDASAATGETAIASAVIALAHSLGLSVVAEGVETGAQHAYLVAQGCDAWQGFLGCRPVPLDQLRAYLEARAARPATVLSGSA